MTHHQVRKYKTASVTRKDVVTTELLCLAEAGDGEQNMKKIIEVQLPVKVQEKGS